MWRQQFDKEIGPIYNSEGNALMNLRTKHFISNTHKEIFTDFQEAMGQEWFNREVKVKKLMEKWL